MPKSWSLTILDPLEWMIEKVRLIAHNPLFAANEDLDKMGVWGFTNV